MTSSQTRQQPSPKQTSQIYVTSCCLDGEVQQVRGRIGGQQTATGVLLASFIPVVRFPTGPNSPISNRPIRKLETVSIAEPLQKPAACAPNAVNTREQGKEGGMVR